MCSLRLNCCRSGPIRPTGSTPEKQNAQKPVPDTSQITPGRRAAALYPYQPHGHPCILFIYALFVSMNFVHLSAAAARHPTRWKVYGPASERGRLKRSPTQTPQLDHPQKEQPQKRPAEGFLMAWQYSFITDPVKTAYRSASPAETMGKECCRNSKSAHSGKKCRCRRLKPLDRSRRGAAALIMQKPPPGPTGSGFE